MFIEGVMGEGNPGEAITPEFYTVRGRVCERVWAGECVWAGVGGWVHVQAGVLVCVAFVCVHLAAMHGYGRTHTRTAAMHTRIHARTNTHGHKSTDGRLHVRSSLIRHRSPLCLKSCQTILVIETGMVL